MSVVIRMKRTGRRNRPCYRISVAEKSFPRDGRTLEGLGVYDPVSPVVDLRLKLDVERARHWLQHGAQPSDTVRSIFKREGVYEGQPQPKKRKRGSRKKTATSTRRVGAKKIRTERKALRHAERVGARRTAKKAAAAEAAVSDS